MCIALQLFENSPAPLKSEISQRMNKSRVGHEHFAPTERRRILATHGSINISLLRSDQEFSQRAGEEGLSQAPGLSNISLLRSEQKL
jgi:hypothetical protein